MTAADHAALLEVLKAHKGPALISGYDSPLYNDALHSWYRQETTVRAQTGGERREVLWMNREPPIQQLNLFYGQEETGDEEQVTENI